MRRRSSRVLLFILGIHVCMSLQHRGPHHEPQRHVVGAPRESSDPAFSALRRAALEEQLAALGIDEVENDETLAGTPALKTFNTFINPRAEKLAHAKAEALAPAAARTAHQVAFLVRQRRAELADWLRNKDRAASAREAAGLALQPLTLVLDNVRSAYNVGSILRTAETAGVAEVICCGYTPCPPHDKVQKTAFDAADTVPTRHFPSTLAALEDLRRNGWTVYGMETTSRSLPYTSVTFPQRTVLVLGNEVTGVDTAVMDACDELCEIPTYGMKNSLNVASAAPVVVFEVLRQWGATDQPSAAL
jgi:23S rRNA (guanosine2251-2'-O)-methyltransferase